MEREIAVGEFTLESQGCYTKIFQHLVLFCVHHPSTDAPIGSAANPHSILIGLLQTNILPSGKLWKITIFNGTTHYFNGHFNSFVCLPGWVGIESILGTQNLHG